MQNYKNLTITLLCLCLFQLWHGRAMAERNDPGEEHFESRWQQKLQHIRQNPASALTAFTTDGCSGGLSVGWEVLAGQIERFQEVHGQRPPWEECCVAHDRLYHVAGGRDLSTGESIAARRKADRQLQACVEATGSTRKEELSSAYQLSTSEVERLYSFIADLMYRAVRLGGVPCSGLPWRWGYGWPKCN